MRSVVCQLREAFVEMAISENRDKLAESATLDPSTQEVILANEATIALSRYAANLRYVLRGLMATSSEHFHAIIRLPSNVALREAYRCLLEVENRVKIHEIREISPFPPAAL